ncbi:hypothetical protein, partial [Paracoccus benzoatiresistens]|uniref:hypothetical protein n=1 Tax=Paracoccus benzoatiresistens TaxID=2997341 RepID=UPI0035300DAE
PEHRHQRQTGEFSSSRFGEITSSTHTELLLLQFGNPNPQRLNQQVMCAQAGGHLLIFCLQRGNDRLQGGRIIGQWRGRSGHGDG